MGSDRLSKTFLVFLVIGITATFVAMIRSFLTTILLAAIFAGMAHPLFARILRAWRGHRALASLATLGVLFVVIVVPVLAVLGIVASEALSVSQKAAPWVQAQLAEPDRLAHYLANLPGYENIAPFREQILTKAAALVGSAGTFLFNSLSAMTRGTVAFLFQVFILLYTMFFFLMDGEVLLRKMLYYLPLDDDDERRMVDKFTSVARATLKGTVLIGLAQGTLAGLAFWVVGIQGAVFWGTLMAVLSIIPGIGTGLVWLPAAVVLVAGGHTGKGIGLALFCALIVGSIDNVLRPRLVGRDTRMHDLMILFGTMGGILLFGVLGFIIGPIVAALFVTVWEIYGVVFREMLPEVRWLGPGAGPGPPEGQ